MAAEPEFERLYAGSDDRYYAESQVRRKLNRGEWVPCLRETKTGQRLLGRGDGELVMLVPIAVDALPAWTELRETDRGLEVVDGRRTLP